MKVSPSDTADKIARAEVERLNKMRAVANTARVVPRRLGKDASDEELAADARTSRRIMHVAEQSIKAWGGTMTPNGEVNREASQVVWRRWLDEHRTWLTNRMRYIATWQYQTGSDERWCKGAVVRLQNELHWLEYALRDCP
jgi:hypothetical protein